MATFWAETLNKLALPIVTAIVALAGTIVTSNINEANNLRTTINQREQAETTLRTSMFRELVNPLLARDPNNPTDEGRPQRLALLAELLALNFHEHFELGPLLTYVDEMPDQTVENRRRLRSVARRVISRQIAVLGQPAGLQRGDQCKSEATDVDIWLTSAAHEPVGSPQACAITSLGSRDSAFFQCSSTESEPATLKPFTVSSPDCQDRFAVTLAELNWTNHSVRVLVSSIPAASKVEGNSATAQSPISEFVEFTLSPYALPFSDNTLLRTGNRFGIYIRQIEPSRDPCKPPACDPSMRLMRLSLIWFPNDFIPPRERPTDFRRIRKSLKM